MKSIIAALLFAVLVTGSHAKGVVTPGWTPVPSPSVTVHSVTPPNWGQTSTTGRPWCSVYAYTYNETVRSQHVYVLDGSSRPIPWGDTYCFGVNISDLGKPESLRQIANAVEGITIPFSHTTSQNPGYGDGYCMWAVQVVAPGGGSMIQYSMTGCAEPAPVSCALSDPGIISHPATVAGMVRARQEITINISCDRPATVNVSTTGEIVLKNGRLSLPSRLYVQTEGTTSSKVAADPEARVRVISIIDATQAIAGEYSGSGVIVVDWD